MSREIDKPLLGPHAFRQTQTAMSTYYMVRDPALFFDYVTPVLGKPWSIPMELPVYQWVTARWQNLSDWPLDVSGKAISILFWLFCLVPVGMLLKDFGLGRAATLTCLPLFLLSPLYLFWTPTFLIESTGLFFALMMVALAVRSVVRYNVLLTVPAVFFGILAAMVKATTWSVAAGTGVLLIIVLIGRPRLADARYPAIALCALLLPVLPAKMWLSYGDAQKKQNPFAREMLMANSPHQSAWNYGSWEQKTSRETWQVIGRHITDQLLPGPLVLLAPFLLIAAALADRRKALLLGALVAGFLSGPVVFTNLYFEHSYYWYANGVWLILSLAVALHTLSRTTWLKQATLPACLVLGGVFVFSGLSQWKTKFHPILQSLPARDALTESWTIPVQLAVSPGRTVLILGNDWNPIPLYYAERKGIMLPSTNPTPEASLTESLSLLSPAEAPQAVVVHPSLITPGNQQFLTQLLTRLGMGPNGQNTPFGVLFTSEK